MEEHHTDIFQKARSAYITKMEESRARIFQRAYEDINKSFLAFSCYLSDVKTNIIHKSVFALHQIKLTPTLYFHEHVLKLDEYNEREKPLLIAYFDLLIHLQFLFGVYLIDNDLSKFQQSIEEISYDYTTISIGSSIDEILYHYTTLPIGSTYYDIPDNNSIGIKIRTGKGSRAKNKKSIEKWLTGVSMTKSAQKMYYLAGQTTYLLYSNKEYGEGIIKIASSIHSTKSIIWNLKNILSKFEKNDRESLLSICSPNMFLPAEYKERFK